MLSIADAVGGLLLGCVEFVDRMRRLLSDRAEDRGTPQLTKLRHRPPLTSIVCVVAEYSGTDADNWQLESRHDDASRAVAAYLARREFGFPAKRIADTFGYRSHTSMRNAILRVEGRSTTRRPQVEGKTH